MDTTIALFIHNHLPFGPFLKFITGFGSTWVLMITAVSTALILLFTLKFNKAHMVLLSAVFASLSSFAIKYIVARPRPQLWPALEEAKGYGFPSGHALASTVIYGTIAVFLAERYPRRRGLIYGVYAALIFFIGLSRVYLGVHWPTDVLGGWLIGAVLLAAMIWWYHSGGITRTLRIALGLTAILIGLVWIIIPILPGVPFLIAGVLLAFSDKSLFKGHTNRHESKRINTNSR